ncbi:MAG: hypothetical protein P4M09_06580 [Devosia sp.]|nr:hypothetical protein [Devosia sp.]
MQVDPELPGADLEPVDLHVDPVAGWHSLGLPDVGRIEGTSRHVLTELHRLVMRDVLRSHGRHPIIHGAAVIVGGKRFLLIAPKGVGKTTLALHLLARGHLVEGDEHLIVNADDVIARPRNLRVKATSFDIVEGLPAAIRDTPRIELWDGTLIHAVSPSVVGTRWIVAPGPLDHIVLLEPNRGGRSVAAPMSANDAFRALMANSYAPERGFGAAAARLRLLAVRTPAHRLWLGDLGQAEWHLDMLSRS